MNRRLTAFRFRHRSRLLALGLLLALAAPFGLYAGLIHELAVLSAACFGAIVASMALAIWAG